jgi:hypothetical protein
MADRCPRCGTQGFASPEPCKSCGWEDPVLEPWVARGWYPDPARSGGARWWEAPAKRWVGNPRKNVAPQAIPTTPPPGWTAPQLVEREIVRVADCRVLGGHGLYPSAGQTWDLVFTESGLSFRRGRDQAGAIPYSEITAFEIGGPGATRQEGGFMGGGFGVQGAAEGMLIATALNMLTTRTRVATVICLQTRTAELFFHNGSEPPDVTRIRLSPVFSVLRQQQSAPATPPILDANTTGGSVVDQLAKLAELLDKGLITPEEFATLKSDLLG